MSSVNRTTLFKSIAQFLKKEVECGTYSSEVVESLEVAKQCLESAFNFSIESEASIPDLISIYEAGSSQQQNGFAHPEPSEEEKAMAETLKNQGNHCMKESKFEEAVACYTKAIELAPRVAVYYCNRAAANSRQEKQREAIEDCQSALRIDPHYSKAYGRMGIAYSSLGDDAKAAEAYRKGLESDPTNENCRQNLTLTEERLRDAQANPTSQNASGGGLNLGGMDFGALLNNPMMQNIAGQLMRDPNTQNVMADMFRTTFSGADAPNAAPSTERPAAPTETPSSTTADASGEQPSGAGGMDQFLRYGQQLAQELRSSNPQLVDQLRNAFQSSQAPPDPTNPNAP